MRDEFCCGKDAPLSISSSVHGLYAPMACWAAQSPCICVCTRQQGAARLSWGSGDSVTMSGNGIEKHCLEGWGTYSLWGAKLMFEKLRWNGTAVLPKA